MSTQPTPEWHNPNGLTDEQVGVKDGWRLCLKTETEHEGCEWFSHEYRKWRGICIYEGHPLSPFITYRTRRPLPESSTEPKEGGEPPCPMKESDTCNAAAGTSNPFQHRRK